MDTNGVNLALLGSMIALALATVWGWVKVYLLLQQMSQVKEKSAQEEQVSKQDLALARHLIVILQRDMANSISSFSEQELMEREFRALKNLLDQEKNWYTKLSVNEGCEGMILSLRYNERELAKLKLYWSVPEQSVFCIITVVKLERNVISESTTRMTASRVFKFIEVEVLNKLPRRNISRVLHVVS